MFLITEWLQGRFDSVPGNETKLKTMFEFTVKATGTINLFLVMAHPVHTVGESSAAREELEKRLSGMLPTLNKVQFTLYKEGDHLFGENGEEKYFDLATVPQKGTIVWGPGPEYYRVERVNYYTLKDSWEVELKPFEY